MMHFYYLQGDGVHVSQSITIRYLGLAIMGLLTITAGFVAGAYMLRKWRERSWGWSSSTQSLNGKIIVITGANSGIGLEAARGLARLRATVVLACRDTDKAQLAVADIRTKVSSGELVVMECDLGNSESVRKFVYQLLSRYSHVHVLINNAGVYHPPQQPPITNEQGIELHFAVNHLGHFLLTHLLTDTLTATPDSRIVIVSSELYKSGRVNVDDLLEGAATVARGNRNPLYNNSKLANILHARQLHLRLRGRGVRVCALSPGFVYTGIFRHSMHQFGWLKKIAFLPIAFFFMRSAVQGAQTTIHCASSPLIVQENNGESANSSAVPYYQNCRKSSLTPVAEDDDTALRLWNKSLQLLKLET